MAVQLEPAVRMSLELVNQLSCAPGYAEDLQAGSSGPPRAARRYMQQARAVGASSYVRVGGHDHGKRGTQRAAQARRRKCAHLARR